MNHAKKMRWRKFLFICCLSFCNLFFIIKVSHILAQGLNPTTVTLHTNINPKKISLMDTCNLELTLEWSGQIPNLAFSSPDLRLNNKLELIGSSLTNASWEREGKFIHRKKYCFTLQGRETGIGVIEPVTIQYTRQPGESPQILTSIPFEINISKMHLKLSDKSKKIIAIISMFILFLIIITPLALFIWLSREKKKLSSLSHAQRPPSLEEQSLFSLKEVTQLRRNGSIRQYHEQIASIVKQYLSKKYQFNVIEKTTSMIIEDLDKTLKNEKLLRQIDEILTSCDRVKFAQYIPTGEEIDKIYALTEDFIKQGGNHSDPSLVVANKCERS